MRFKRVIYMTSMSDPMKRVVNTRIENNTLFSNKILSSLQLLGVQTTPFYLQAPCSWFLGVKPKLLGPDLGTIIYLGRRVYVWYRLHWRIHSVLLHGQLECTAAQKSRP